MENVNVQKENAPLCKTTACNLPLTRLGDPQNCWRCLVCNPLDTPPKTEERKGNYIDVRMTEERVREMIKETYTEERIREIIREEISRNVSANKRN